MTLKNEGQGHVELSYQLSMVSAFLWIWSCVSSSYECAQTLLTGDGNDLGGV